jgi:hypothetical protein
MFSQDIFVLLAALAALAAAGSLWAARAAHRSALAAEEAARHAHSVDRRAILRDLITNCHRLIVESVQIGSLIEQLKVEYRILATLSGESGGSREKFLIQRAESRHKEIGAFQEEARQCIRERAQLLNASEEDFTAALSKFDGYLVRVLGIKDSLERELASVAGNNRIYREGRIKGMNQRLQRS